MAIPLKEEFFLVVEAQLCERRSDTLAERNLSRGSTRGWKATTSIQALLYFSKNRLFFGASRKLLSGTASYAILRGWRLNGWGCPFEGRN